MMPEAIERLRASSPIPVPVLITLQLVQSAVIFLLLAWLALLAARRVGLDAPLLRAWVDRSPLPADPRTRDFRPALVLGLVAAAAIIGLDVCFSPLLPHPVTGTAVPNRWEGFLASFYGGITEEFMLRLLLMTGVAWALAAVKRVRVPAVPAWIYWAAIVIASVLFAAGHLPLALRYLGPGAIVVARTLALNFPAGILFGWLYWKRGLEHAMVAHFAADVVLHVLVAG